MGGIVADVVGEEHVQRMQAVDAKHIVQLLS
jgi:hypothetical protein